MKCILKPPSRHPAAGTRSCAPDYFAKYNNREDHRSIARRPMMLLGASCSVILELHVNFLNGLFNNIQSWNYSRLKLLFNFYARRTVQRQDFGAKFKLSYHNGVPVADILYKKRYDIARCIRFGP